MRQLQEEQYNFTDKCKDRDCSKVILSKANEFCCAITPDDADIVHLFIGANFKVDVYTKEGKLVNSSDSAFASSYPITIVTAKDNARLQYSNFLYNIMKKANLDKVKEKTTIVLKKDWQGTMKMNAQFDENNNLVGSVEVLEAYNPSNFTAFIEPTSQAIFLDDTNFYDASTLSQYYRTDNLMNLTSTNLQVIPIEKELLKVLSREASPTGDSYSGNVSIRIEGLENSDLPDTIIEAQPNTLYSLDKPKVDNKPGETVPETSKPGTSSPEGSKPETNKPEGSKPDGNKSGDSPSENTESGKEQSPNPDNKKLSAGAIVGIVIAVLAVVCVITFAAIWYMRSKKPISQSEQDA